MIKKIDFLGRIVIPQPLREEMDLKENDFITMAYDSDQNQIILKKATNSCFSCRKSENLLQLENGFVLCKKCLDQLKKEEAKK